MLYPLCAVLDPVMAMFRIFRMRSNLLRNPPCYRPLF